MAFRRGAVQLANLRLAAVVHYAEYVPCSKTGKCPCSHFGNMLDWTMRVIARNVLVSFWVKHPEAKVSLERWLTVVRAAQWTSTDEVQKAAPKAKVLNRERVRFEVAGGNYRLVAAFDFRRQIAFVKFIGSHAEYDRIDALKVSQF
jgi:mRNA interferase HigB